MKEVASGRPGEAPPTVRHDSVVLTEGADRVGAGAGGVGLNHEPAGREAVDGAADGECEVAARKPRVAADVHGVAARGREAERDGRGRGSVL